MKNYIIGIDEVGRGPLAGPVTVGVVMCEKKMYTTLTCNTKYRKSLPPLGKDSKKLSRKERERYERVLKNLHKEGNIQYAVVHVSNTVIDIKGIVYAISKAMKEGIKKLQLDPKQCEVRLDGGLKAPMEFVRQKTIIKGDEKEQVIAWASILAKVSRDALMVRLSNTYTDYGMEMHKGYGTLKHRNCIKNNGLSAIHRKTFCTRI